MATDLERSRSAASGLRNSSSTESATTTATDEPNNNNNNNDYNDSGISSKLPPPKRPISVSNSGRCASAAVPSKASRSRPHRPLRTAQSVDSPLTSPVASPPIGIKPFAVGGLATSAATYREAAEARSQILNEIKSLQVKRSSSFKRMIRGIPKSLSSGNSNQHNAGKGTIIFCKLFSMARGQDFAKQLQSPCFVLQIQGDLPDLNSSFHSNRGRCVGTTWERKKTKLHLNCNQIKSPPPDLDELFMFFFLLFFSLLCC